MNPIDEAIEQAIHKDPLYEAEKITGHSYKEDQTTSLLGMFLHMQHSEKKQELLESNGDTVLCNELPRYLTILNQLNFKMVLEIPFHSTLTPSDEMQYVLYRKPGLLLVFDTFYNQQSVNSANIYYNWTPKNGFENFYKETKGISVTSSGCWNKKGEDDGRDIWSGCHDAREALKHKIKKLERYGSFIEPWCYRPFVCLCNHQDFRDSEKETNWQARMNDITNAKIAMLPPEIQAVIQPS